MINLKGTKAKVILLCLLVILGVQLGLGSPGYSDVAAELQNMFNEFGFRAGGSEGGAYYGQTRGFLTGGSMTARGTTKYIQPLSIQLPDLKAGCGGIDMFFGGFNFINAEEFQRFLQAAGTAAIGYAFHLGLEAVCPTCNSTLKALRNFADQINKFGLDSCTAAKAAVNFADRQFEVSSQLSKAVNGQNDDGNQTQPGFWSPVKGFLTDAGDTISEIHQKIYNAASDPTKNPGPKPGIGAAKICKAKGMSEKECETFISMVSGKQPKKGVPEEGGEKKPTVDCVPYPATIGFNELMNGAAPGNPVTFYKCENGFGSLADGTCTSLEEYKDENFKGYRKMAYDNMIAIKDKIIANQQLSETEKAFINSIPAPPILNIIKASSVVSSTFADVAVMLTSDIAATFFTMYTLNEVFSTFRHGATAPDSDACGVIPFDEIQKVQADARAALAEFTTGLDAYEKTINFIRTIESQTASHASPRIIAAMQPWPAQ